MRSLDFALVVDALGTRFRRDERGQSFVETALLLPVLIFLILAGGDLARAYAMQLAVQNGARAGAEAAAIDFSPTTTAAEARARDEMGRTPGMDPAVPTVTVTFATAANTQCIVDPPTDGNQCYATVRVQFTFHTVTPWPLIPNTAALDRSTKMRMVKAGCSVPPAGSCP
jgi:Flp pilus assembly protein TadG